jgi:ABC-2 type transport system permease protein
MSGPRSYSAVARGSMMASMAYRFSFLFMVAGNIAYMFVAWYLWRSIYAGRATLRGLSFDQAFLYVVAGSSVFLLLKSYAEWRISRDIREGSVAVLLTKPVDYQLYILADVLGSAATSLAVVAVPTALLLAFVFKVDIALGPGLVLFPASLVLAYLVNFNIDYTVGLLAFYTESTWGLSIVKDFLVSFLAGALLPLQFFPEPAQRILLWLPFQAVYYSPLTMLSQADRPVPDFLRMLAVQLFWVLASFALTRLLYRKAIKALRVSGG